MSGMRKAFQLSAYELWVLLSRGQSRTVIGYRNPMSGLLTDDAFPLVQEATQSLLDKDLIEFDSEANVKLKGVLTNIVGTFASPRHTLLIAFRLNGSNIETVRSININGAQSVLLQELPDGNYLMQEVGDKNDMISIIAEPFSKKVFWAPDTDPLLVAQDDMVQIQVSLAAGDVNSAKRLVEKSEGDDESKLHLLKSLQAPKVNYTLIGYIDRDNPQMNRVDGFTIIADDHYIWLIEIVDDAKKISRVSKITMKSLSRKIAAMIPLP